MPNSIMDLYTVSTWGGGLSPRGEVMFPLTQQRGQGLGDSVPTDISPHALLCPTSNPPRERKEVKALRNFT